LEWRTEGILCDDSPRWRVRNMDRLELAERRYCDIVDDNLLGMERAKRSCRRGEAGGKVE